MLRLLPFVAGFIRKPANLNSGWDNSSIDGKLERSSINICFLLICIYCILFRNRYQRIILISISLFLTSHTSVHALILTICITIGLGFEYIFKRKQIIDSENTINRKIWIGFSIMWIGILTAILQLNPPPDTGFAVGWKTNFDLSHLKNVIKIICMRK